MSLSGRSYALGLIVRSGVNRDESITLAAWCGVPASWLFALYYVGSIHMCTHHCIVVADGSHPVQKHGVAAMGRALSISLSPCKLASSDGGRAPLSHHTLKKKVQVEVLLTAKKAERVCNVLLGHALMII